MATTEFIAAIEIGSSHIAGMTGRKQSDGSLQVLAYASEPSSAFVRKGVVNNIDKTARALRSIVNRLEAESGAAIDKLYVGISGQPLRTVRNSVSRQLDGEQIISVELVDAICDENRGCYPTGGDIEVLDVVPQEYKIDNQLQCLAKSCSKCSSSNSHGGYRPESENRNRIKNDIENTSCK